MTQPEIEEYNGAFWSQQSAAWQPARQKNDGQHGVGAANSELHGILMTALQMQNLVLLAGSGCSLSAKGPSMRDLWKATVDGPGSCSARAIAEMVHHDVDNDRNIEAFLSRMEAYLQMQEDDSVRNYLNVCKATILDECTTFLHGDNLYAHQTFLHRLSRRRVREQRLKVFTTNYDLCFERAAGQIGNVVLDGFSFTAPRQYDSSFFNYDIVRRPRGENDTATYLEGVFLLYKLHGSVNWSRELNGAIVEHERPTPNDACLIYPAQGKYQQSFTQPYLESLAQYLSSLREPNTCLLVVGFGFNDDHLSEPLLTAVRSNPYMRLIIVDPFAKEKTDNGGGYWEQFKDLASRGADVHFVAARFDDFAELIPDLSALSPGDSLVSAIQRIRGGQ